MGSLPFDWFVLLLRILFIFLLYFFIYQVVRVVTRELRVVATRQAPARARDRDDGDFNGALMVTDPGESNLRRGDVYDLEPVTVIGRHPRANIVVQSSFMSSQHAQLTWDQERWWISDMKSTNGTFVNGAQIRVATGIRPGDTLEVGGVRFQLVP